MVRVYDFNNYHLMGFRLSNRRYKKYDAILVNIYTGKIKYVPFGDSRYYHYKDSTGLGLWSHKDHGDNNRRMSFKSRHEANAAYKFSSAWFANRYLW
jgi:hypothetical protein